MTHAAEISDPTRPGGRTRLADEELLRRLVGIDSTSARGNRAIAELVLDYLEAPDVELVVFEREEGEKLEVLALKGPPPGPDGEGLLLAGHLDTVPAEEEGWVRDPFELHERDGAWIGRGTADMKGFDCLAIQVFRETDARTLAHPLGLILTSDEEVGSLGARHLAESWPRERPLPRSAVIGEPTSLRVVRMHKGHLKVRLTVRGRAAHSGSPHLGVNAIERAGTLLARLRELRERLGSRRTPTSPFFPEVPHPVLTVARIRGGEALNVIPDRCTVDVGIRLLPGEDAAEVLAMVRDAGAEVDAELVVLGDNPPLLTPEDAPLHRALQELTGQRESRGVSFASDGGWLSTMGIDCVLWGPGSIEVAHRPNERLPVEEFVRARGLLERLVRRLVVAPGGASS